MFHDCMIGSKVKTIFLNKSVFCPAYIFLDRFWTNYRSPQTKWLIAKRFFELKWYKLKRKEKEKVDFVSPDILQVTQNNIFLSGFIVSVLLSAHIERFSVSCMRVFIKYFPNSKTSTDKGHFRMDLMTSFLSIQFYLTSIFLKLHLGQSSRVY